MEHYFCRYSFVFLVLSTQNCVTEIVIKVWNLYKWAEWSKLLNIVLYGWKSLVNRWRVSLIFIFFQCEVFSREHLARKTKLSHNLEDVFCRQHLSGDPGIREKDKPVKCIRCRSKEHYTVACPQKTATVTRRDDALVNSFLLTTIEEEPKEQATFMKNLKESWNI